MRQIKKQAQPAALTQWIGENRKVGNCNYGSMDRNVREVIRQYLVQEQGSLCAYTGRKIDDENCHIEHLKPQAHCRDGEDVAYKNLVAAIPKPNAHRLPYGAHKKDNWPSDDVAELFVSPLSNGCAERFSFNLRGKVTPANSDDVATSETIERLGLNDGELVSFRRAAIASTLTSRGKGPASIDKKSARRRLDALEQKEQEDTPLEQFSFVIIQALKNHIDRLDSTMKKKKN